MDTIPITPQPLWFAVRFDDATGRDRALEAAARTCALHGYGADHDVRVSVSAHAMLLTAGTDRVLGQMGLIHSDDATHSCATNFALTEARADDPSWLKDMARLTQGTLPELWRLPPPVSYVQHEVVGGSIVAATDFFGAGKVYMTEHRGLDACGSALAPLALLRAPDLACDDRAWRHYLAFDWVLDDRTFYHGITLLPPGGRVTYSAGGAKVERSHDYAAVRAAGRDAASEDDAIAAGRAILEGGSRLSPRPEFSIGLSGGRDSRCVAAMALTSGAQASYYTQIPPDLEGEIAEQLVARAPTQMDWTLRDTKPREPGPPPGPLAERADYWFARTGGDGWPSHVLWPIPPRDPGPAGAITLSGGGGEIVRAHFYGKAQAGDGMDRVRWFLDTQTSLVSTISRGTREACAHDIRAILFEGAMLDLEGPHLLDWFYVRSQQRRRVPTHLSTAIAFPLYTPQMFLAGFRATSTHKAEGGLAAALTARMVPEWATIPYFADLEKTRPRKETSKVAVRPYHWEQDREGYLAVVDEGLDLYGDIAAPDARERFHKVSRADRRAGMYQNGANRLAWRVGFQRWDDRLRALAARPAVPLPEGTRLIEPGAVANATQGAAKRLLHRAGAATEKGRFLLSVLRDRRR